MLDLGCGEGWLARALASHGIAVTGIDASAPLIESARSLGGATFHVMRYEDVAALPRFDMTVANFSLLDDRTSSILHALRSDVVIIQTVCLDEPEGWRLETFATFDGHWPEPMPWYHRPRPSWLTLLAECGFDLLSAIDTTRSVIFTARRNGSN